MAEKYINIGPFGPFIYDDTDSKAVDTDGTIEAENFAATALTANIRKVLSNQNKAFEEISLGYYFSASITSADSPYSAGSEELILVDASSGDVTVNLPSAGSVTHKVMSIKRTDSSDNIVTVDGNGTEVIEDEETKTLKQFDAMRIASDGTQWWII